MKRLTSILAGATLVAGTSLVPMSAALAGPHDAMADCRKMAAAYMETYNKGDAKGLAKMYAAEALFSNPFWTAKGREAIGQGYGAELAGGTKYTSIGCDRSVDVGPVGYAEGQWAATAMGPDGKPMNVTGHYSVVVKPEKSGGYVFVTHVANMQLPPPGAPTH